MNRPQVVALIYDVEHGLGVGYKSTAHLVREEEKFLITIKNKEARFQLKEHHATEGSARRVVEPYVHRWEFSAGLTRGPRTFRLKYRKAEIRDLDPTPGVVEIRAGSRHAVRRGVLHIASTRVPVADVDGRRSAESGTLRSTESVSVLGGCPTMSGSATADLFDPYGRRCVHCRERRSRTLTNSHEPERSTLLRPAKDQTRLVVDCCRSARWHHRTRVTLPTPSSAACSRTSEV